MLSLGSQSFQVIRQESGRYVDGVWTEGRDYSLYVRGSIQPVNMRERDLLPEGIRVSETRKLYTDADLMVTEPGVGRRGDLLKYEGKCWRIHAATQYDRPTGRSLAHKKYWLTRRNNDDSE